MRAWILAAVLLSAPALADSLITTRPGGAASEYAGVLAEYQEGEAYLAFWSDDPPLRAHTEQLFTTGFDSRAWRMLIVVDSVPSVVHAVCEAHAGEDGVAMDCYGP